MRVSSSLATLSSRKMMPDSADGAREARNGAGRGGWGGLRTLGGKLILDGVHGQLYVLAVDSKELEDQVDEHIVVGCTRLSGRAQRVARTFREVLGQLAELEGLGVVVFGERIAQRLREVLEHLLGGPVRVSVRHAPPI